MSVEIYEKTQTDYGANVLKCYSRPIPALCPRVGRITQGNFKFSVSLSLFSFLPLIITFPSGMCTLYSPLSITAYNPDPRYVFGSWYFRETCSDLEDLCCIHLGNTTLYATDNKCWLAFCNLKALMNHFRELGCPSVCHAVC